MVGRNYGIKISTNKNKLHIDINDKAIIKTGSIDVKYDDDGFSVNVKNWVVEGRRRFWHKKINCGFLIEGDTVTIEGDAKDCAIDIGNGDIIV